MRSDRLLATMLLLQTHGRLPAPEIARRLEVSTRTVHRDVEALSAAGVPVYCERGRTGGVVLLDGYRTDVTGLTDEEMRALFVLGGTGSDERGLGPVLASAARKLTAALPESRRSDVDRARQRLLVEGRGWRRGADDVPALPVLEAALVSDERLRMRYRPGDGTPAWRTVDPYGLVSKGGVWYLIAAHRGQARMYRVSRVLDVRPTGTPARRPDDRTLAEVWGELRDRLERGADAVTVRFAVRADRADRVQRLVAAQLTGPPTGEPGDDGRVVVTAPFRALGAARAVLLGLGAVVEVLEPGELRDEMAAVAREVVELYRPAVRRR